MTLATRITLARFALAVILIPFFYLGTEFGYLVTIFLFVGAILTDVLDGYVARKFNQRSNLGGRLDALIDKAIIYSLLFSLFYMRVYNPFLVFSMFFRDMIVDGLRNAAPDASEGIPSNVWGKSKFALQSLSALSGLAYCVDPAHSEWTWIANLALLMAFFVSLPGLWVVATAVFGVSHRKRGNREVFPA
jgi:CDP-diacylglycerol--glycerol-3-phosphate 3-phosphatidyltransferase